MLQRKDDAHIILVWLVEFSVAMKCISKKYLFVYVCMDGCTFSSLFITCLPVQLLVNTNI